MGVYWIRNEAVFYWLIGGSHEIYFSSFDISGINHDAYGVRQFEVLSFLCFLGYPVRGWDYDFSVSGDVISYRVGSVLYTFDLHSSAHELVVYCDFAEGSCVALVDGSLFARIYIFKSNGGAVKWVLPLDLLLYWNLAGHYHYMDAGLARFGEGESYFDLTALDAVDGDFSKLYDDIFYGHRCRCYGGGFSKWLWDECWSGFVSGLIVSGQMRDSILLNADYFKDMIAECTNRKFLGMLAEFVPELFDGGHF